MSVKCAKKGKIVSKNITGLINHGRIVHDRVRYICAECGQPYRNFKRHKALHCTGRHTAKSEDFFYCKLCEFFTLSKISSRLHQQQEHPTAGKEKPALAKLSCDSCSYKTHGSFGELSGMHLILHKKIHRDGNIVCDLCEFITRGRFTFQKHLAIKHNIGQVYSCTLCDHKTGGVSGKGHLKTHMERHNKEKDHMCDKCDFKSGTESSLKKHLQRHKENYKYLCDVCDYKSHDFSNFQAHKKTKHSSIVLSCEECDFTTKSDRTFRNHNSKHSTSLNCGNCDYKTNSRMALRHHKTINLHRN